MHGLAVGVYYDYGSVSLAAHSYSAEVDKCSNSEAVGGVVVAGSIVVAASLVLSSLLILLRRSTALAPVVWAILHHVVHKATFKTSTSDSIA